jgi:gluconate 2-dehydrogenase gamma chain
MTLNVDRRGVLQRLAAAAGAAYWTGDTLAVEMAKAAASRPAPTVAASALPAALRPTLAALADLIIPPTKTAGAVKAGVPAFIHQMVEQWMTPRERDAFVAGLQDLDDRARAQFKRSFARCSVAQKTELFGALRAGLAGYKPSGFGLAARIADEGAPFFHKARDLVTLGYFTSELGIQQELAYVAVPGRFDGDVDVKTWNRQMQL